MKTKIISAAALSSVLAASLLMSGTAFADTLELNHGIKLGVQVGAQSNRGDNEDHVTANANVNANVSGKVDNDNDNDRGEGKHATSTQASSTKAFIKALIVGTGQPVIGGTVSAVSGNTVTVFTSAGITYTVNASSSTIVKGHATTTVSGITVGDKVLVQGAVSGTSITASSVIDSNTGTSTNKGFNGHNGLMLGVFGKIGLFFHSMFGFFK